MDYPLLSDTFRLERLKAPTGPVRMVLDTDTFNEIDDQFCVVHALLSPEKLKLEAIHAAPFLNNRSTSAGDGMEKSHEEILRLLERMNRSPEGLVFRGSRGFLEGPRVPQESEAARDLVERALASEEPLYVAAIGAITNVASALLLEPKIVERIVVVWLGGQPHHWPHTGEFNLQQDLFASRVLFDSGVPLVQIPTSGVSSHLLSTAAEIERYVQPCGAIGAFLAERFLAYSKDHFAWSKEIWDVAATAWLLDASWVPTELAHSPILTDQMTWSHSRKRHLIRVANWIYRDRVFKDLFTKLRVHAEGAPAPTA
ncbi:MAG: nucleoside hydrolase [Puniceicoccaceae bacterium]|nr:MAG: nucleoside hydrolase [Puniceicoccaceae bacterium]